MEKISNRFSHCLLTEEVERELTSSLSTSSSTSNTWTASLSGRDTLLGKHDQYTLAGIYSVNETRYKRLSQVEVNKHSEMAE